LSSQKATSCGECTYGKLTCKDPPEGWKQTKFNVSNKFDNGDNKWLDVHDRGWPVVYYNTNYNLIDKAFDQNYTNEKIYCTPDFDTAFSHKEE